MSDYGEHVISQAGGDGERGQAYIVECDDLAPGDQVWFPNLFEAEHVCGPFEFSCCTLVPVGDDYDGPKWVPEDEQP